MASGVGAQTVIDLGTGKVHGKTADDYRQESIPARFRQSKDSAEYAALVTRGLNFLYRDSLAQARQAFGEAIKLRPEAPGNSHLFYLQGSIEVAMQRYGEAVTYLNQSLKMNPHAVAPRYLRAVSHTELGNTKNALEDCDVLFATQQTEISRMQLCLLRGMASLRGNLFADARRDFEEALRSDPTALSPKLMLAETDRKSGRKQQALERISAILTAAPGCVEAYVKRAQWETADGQHDAALLDYDKAIEYSPHDAQLYRERASVLGALGRSVQQKKDLETAERLLNGQPTDAVPQIRP